MKSSPRIAVIFDNLGPYHVARLAAASKSLEIHAVEFSARSGEYSWDASELPEISRRTINPDGPANDLNFREFRRRLHDHLSELEPDLLAIPGWSGRGAFTAMAWSLKKRVPYILMSDSTQWDEPRIAWKERIKSRLVARAGAALVAGSPHADYMALLGMPQSRIETGYDVVDNQYFSKGANAWRQDAPSSSRNHSPYFLSSCRFIGKKNLFVLFESYAGYVRACSEVRNASPWDLCLLGDGPLKPKLMSRAEELGFQIVNGVPWETPSTPDAAGRVFFPGFRQVGELTRFYGQASAFIHPSTTEQWGLVVNEAMASGLPVAVSARCGCAMDLVRNDINGWTFDPNDIEALRDVLIRIASMCPVKLRSHGDAGRKIIESWGPERFATGLSRATDTALSQVPTTASVNTRIMLRLMSLVSR